MENNRLTKGSVGKSLIKFAIPFMLANLLQILYGATDLFVVGHFATTGDVSAVSIGSQIMATITYTIVGLTTGVTVLLGQYTGAKEEKNMAKTLGNAISLFFILTVVITIPLVLSKNFIVSSMNTPTEAITATKHYLTICLSGTIFITGYNVVSSILRALGDSKTPLLFVAIACVINIVLDFVLVKFVNLGAMGAAIATVSAQGISFVFAIYYLYKRGLGFSFSKKYIKFEKFFVTKIIKIGFPIALQQALVSVSFLLITIVINKMGVVASASVGVVEKLIEFLMLPPIAMGSAVSVMVAQNIGAKKLDRAKKCMRLGIAFSLSISIILSIYCWFNGETLTVFFTKDKEVIKSAASYLKTYAIDCVMVSFIFNLNGYFSGSNHSMFTMVHSLISTFVLRIPLTMFFSQSANASLTLIGCASPLSSLASIIICLIYLTYINKRNNGISIEN